MYLHYRVVFIQYYAYNIYVIYVSRVVHSLGPLIDKLSIKAE